MRKTDLRFDIDKETGVPRITLPRGGRINFPVGKERDAIECTEDLRQWGNDNATFGCVVGACVVGVGMAICTVIESGIKKIKKMKKEKESREKKENEEE